MALLTLVLLSILFPWENPLHIPSWEAKKNRVLTMEIEVAPCLTSCFSWLQRMISCREIHTITIENGISNSKEAELSQGQRSGWSSQRWWKAPVSIRAFSGTRFIWFPDHQLYYFPYMPYSSLAFLSLFPPPEASDKNVSCFPFLLLPYSRTKLRVIAKRVAMVEWGRI